jgi:hypothetical protein
MFHESGYGQSDLFKLQSDLCFFAGNKKIEESSDAVIRALHKKTPFGGKSFVEFEAQMDSAITEFNEYRNWVAHGKNQHKSPAINASPRFTFNLLTRFITQASTVL